MIGCHCSAARWERMPRPLTRGSLQGQPSSRERRCANEIAISAPVPSAGMSANPELSPHQPNVTPHCRMDLYVDFALGRSSSLPEIVKGKRNSARLLTRNRLFQCCEHRPDVPHKLCLVTRHSPRAVERLCTGHYPGRVNLAYLLLVERQATEADTSRDPSASSSTIGRRKAPNRFP